MVLEFDAKRRAVAQLMATYVYNDGLGVMGQIKSGQTVSSTTLNLADPSTAVHFQIGDVVQLSSTYGGSNTGRTAGTNATLTNGSTTYTGCAYVVGVNLVGANAGTLQVSATPGGSATALNTIWTSVAAGDYLSLVGDQNSPANAGNSAANAIPSGLWAWAGGQNQSSIDSGGTFFGVTRSGSSFLTIQVIDATVNGTNAGSIREALTQAVANLHSVSARPDMIVMHPTRFGTIFGSKPAISGNVPRFTWSRPQRYRFLWLRCSRDANRTRDDNRSPVDPMAVVSLNSTYYPVASGYSGSNIAFVLETDTLEVVAIAEDGQIPFIMKQGTDGNGLLAVIGNDVVFAALKRFIGNWDPTGSRPQPVIVMLPTA